MKDFALLCCAAYAVQNAARGLIQVGRAIASKKGWF